MNKHDFLITDNVDVQKLDIFIIALFDEIETINNNELSDNEIEILNNNTDNLLAAIDFNSIIWRELENKSNYVLMTEYAHEILKMNKLEFTDNRCYSYFDDAFYELIKNY